MIKFRIAGIQEDSIVDGPGLRTVIFFQGCPHKCDGCHNPETWSKRGGYVQSIDEIVETVRRNPLCKAVTFSGGEPLSHSTACLAELAERLKAEGINIWLYTGYSWDLIANWVKTDDQLHRLLHCVDVVVDGAFQKDKRSLDLKFRGSRNQRLVHVLSSLTYGRVIEWIDPEA